MKRKLLTLFGLFVALTLTAAPITKETARKKALQFLTERGDNVAAARSVQPIELQLCDGIAVDQLHVFNVGHQEGFVIVSGDDATIPILGFSNSGSIDSANMPPSMKAWLLGYADQIKWMQEHGNTAEARTAALKKAPRRDPEPSLWTPGNPKVDIGALLSTTWNQGAPYYYQCPGVETSFCVTGCVATAMAQVMNYHQWPTSEIAQIPEYRWENYTSYMNNGYYYNINSYGPKTINWSKMANNYTGSEIDESKTAVATLMRCCGQSVQMNYWTDGSEAQTYKVANALKTYFGYSSTTQYVSRSYYSYANWIDLIYNELSQGRPVIYGGSSVDNGHAFVCDGYKNEGDDKFHINWGWGGQGDGYFALSALDPDVQGIGGSSSGSGYTFGHEAIVGIQKNGGSGTVLNNANFVSLALNSITLSKSNIGQGETIEITVNVTNNSSYAYDGDIVFAVNGIIAYGANVNVPANTTQNCVISYTPRFIGTATISPFIADGNGGYTGNTSVNATLSVGDAMPYNLTASNVTNTTADIGWTSVEAGTKWNVRSRQLYITEVDFNDGLPTGWTEHSQEGDYWIFTPAIKLGGSISFWAGGEGCSGEFRLFRNTSGGYSSISQLFTVNDTPQQYTVDLSGYSGTTDLAFILKNTNGNTIALDNVTIIEPANDWVTVENVTTNPYTLTGLTWESNYEVQVQTVYDASTTGWSKSVIFSTPRITPTDLAAVPTNQSALISWTGYTDSYKVKYRTAATETTTFSDDFNNFNTKGWTITDPSFVHFEEQEDDNFVGLGFHSAGTNCLITPELNNLESGSTVYFYQRYYSSGTTFKVGFSSTTSNTEKFTWGSEQTATSSFTQYSVIIPDGTKYIAIKTTSASQANALFIDDFSICTVTPAGEWATVTTEESSVNITGLTANTTYDYQVIGLENETEVASSDILSFTTNDFELINDDSGAEITNTGLIAAWNGETANVVLAGRTLLGNNQWNTMCLPFDISLTDLAAIIGSTPTCKVFDTDKTKLDNNGELTLAFTDAETTIPAGKPFIIKFNTAEDVDFSSHPLSVTIDGSSTAIGRMTQENSDHNVKFVGHWSSFDITNDNIDEIIFVSSGNRIGYSNKARTLKTLRAHFWVQPNSAGVRSIILDFGDDDVTSIDLVNGGSTTRQSSGWYSLDGRHLQGEPTKKGVYVVNGKKVMK